MMAVEEFPITYVTPRSHSLIKALESAVMAFEDADGYEAKTEAWSKVSIAREALYFRIQELEKLNRRIDKTRTIALRF